MKKFIRANNYNSRGYLYILTNGLGPGTIPKDVSVLKSIELDDFGHPYKTAVWLSRWLTTEELKKYDIMPETNLRTKYGSDLIDEIESLRGSVTASRKSRHSRKIMASRKLQSLVGRPFREVDRILKQMGCKEVNYGDIDEYISYVEYKDAAGQHYDVEYETYAASSTKYSPKVVSGDVISIEGPDEWVDYIGPNEA